MGGGATCSALGGVGCGQLAARREGVGQVAARPEGVGWDGDKWRRPRRGWGGVGTTGGSPIEIDSRVMPFHGMSVAVQLQMTHATWVGQFSALSFGNAMQMSCMHPTFFSHAHANGMINKGPWWWMHHGLACKLRSNTVSASNTFKNAFPRCVSAHSIVALRSPRRRFRPETLRPTTHL